MLANVALISELRLLTKKERKERSNFTKGFENKEGWWGPCVHQITWHLTLCNHTRSITSSPPLKKLALKYEISVSPNPLIELESNLLEMVAPGW